jgi:hypothetical protein
MHRHDRSVGTEHIVVRAKHKNAVANAPKVTIDYQLRYIDVCDRPGSSGRAHDPHNLFSGFLGRKHKIHASAGYRALWHIWLPSGCKLLRDSDGSRLFYAAQCRRPIAIIARDNYRDKFAASMPSERARKYRDHTGPSPWLGDRLQAELSINHM